MSDLVEALRILARENALRLQTQGNSMSGTEITEEEVFVPDWKPANYQTVGAPVKDEGQIYKVLQAHDSTNNPTWTPHDTPALWSICHTTNAAKAKPWIEPLGTSGMYYKDECYIDDGGVVWRQVYDDGNVYNAEATPDRWKAVEVG